MGYDTVEIVKARRGGTPDRGMRDAPAPGVVAAVIGALKKVGIGRREARNTQAGLFLNRDSLKSVVARCASQIEKDPPEGPTVGGREVFCCLRYLSGNESYYLSRGTKCLVGYVLTGVVLDGVSFSESEPVPCKDALLPDDPLFACGTAAGVLENGDFEIALDDGKYRVARQAFFSFVEGIRRQQAACTPLAEHTTPLRDYLLKLVHRLRESTVVECHRPDLQDRFEGATFREGGSWIFVIENGRNVTACIRLNKAPK